MTEDKDISEGPDRKFKSDGKQRKAKGVWQSAIKYRKNRKNKNRMSKASRKRNR